MPTEPAKPQITQTRRPWDVAAPVKPGGIVIARHAEPALSRKVRLSAREYRDWWARYESGGILEGQTPPEHLREVAAKAGIVYTSTRVRAIETARVLVGERELRHEAVFVEAPLPPPPWPDFLRFSPKAWGVISRLSWWLGGHAGEESRQQAEKRAAAAARLLHETALSGHDVLAVAHGFFNSMIGTELRRLGWRCVRGRGYKYWSTRYYER